MELGTRSGSRREPDWLDGVLATNRSLAGAYEYLDAELGIDRLLELQHRYVELSLTIFGQPGESSGMSRIFRWKRRRKSPTVRSLGDEGALNLWR